MPFGVHPRLTALKYIVFLVLFGISLSALGTAEQAAEVEPFKTAIILRFARGWPFVPYAGAMLAASLFVERVFCRYLCPLGAAMAIPARLRLFDWLRRYRECGSPCQRCGNECPVQAIHPEGHINPNECIQCLHCQMLYHHDQKCPVMIQRRLKRKNSPPCRRFPPVLPPRPKVSVRQADEALDAVHANANDFWLRAAGAYIRGNTMTDTKPMKAGGQPPRSVGGTAVAGAAALSGGGAYLEFVQQARAATSAQSAEVKPGDLDEYYGFGSPARPAKCACSACPRCANWCAFRCSTAAARPAGASPTKASRS